MPVLNGKALIEERANAIRKFHEETGIPRAQLDLSGGLDSAVMLGLLVEALGPDNLTVVHSRINTDPKQTARAQRLAKALGVTLIDIDLTPVFDHLIDDMLEALASRMGLHSDAFTDLESRLGADPTILGSIRSCIRAPVGRGFNRMLGNGIRHGTGNECEDRFLRFYQKGGDGEVDTNPIAMLSKTEVQQLAYALGEHFPEARQVYRDHIKAKPSADLWGTGDEHNDEDELRSWSGVAFTYGKVDPETGKVLSFGTIERVNRFLDYYPEEGLQAKTTLFSSTFIDDLVLNTLLPRFIIPNAKESGLFDGFSDEEIRNLLVAARKAEKATRHKFNPNIPTLGNRFDLRDAGIITDELRVE